MYYSIERTLEFFPYACFVILGVMLVFFEIKNIKEMLIDRPRADPGRGGFIPPSGGEGCFPGRGTTGISRWGGDIRWCRYRSLVLS